MSGQGPLQHDAFEPHEDVIAAIVAVLQAHAPPAASALPLMSRWRRAGLTYDEYDDCTQRGRRAW